MRPPPSALPRPGTLPLPNPLSIGPAQETLGTLFAGLFGLLLGVGLLKLGNPVILDRLVELPRNLDEWRVFAWPVRIGYFALLPVAAVGAAFWACSANRRPAGPPWLLGLLAGWLCWQLLAALTSIDPPTTRTILAQFASCVVCFALGHGALSRVAEPRVFWLCLTLGFLGILGVACEQHFGGLEATRKMILEGPEAARLPQEYLARIRSHRVFGTLVYPNALAGAIFLLLPPSVVLVGRWAGQWGTRAAQAGFAALLVLGLLVLVWSGSKAGWLLAMALGLFLLFHANLSVRLKISLAILALGLGLTAFTVKFAEKLAQGPTSVAARWDYWSAAWQGFRERPWLGQGPGAFKRVYAHVKRPESEMAQLAHNDYLQQATDSGWPGFVLYTGFVVGALSLLYRRRHAILDAFPRAVWLGLLGWFAQGLVEFGLYIPATAWCAFALLGWLLAQKPSPSSK